MRCGRCLAPYAVKVNWTVAPFRSVQKHVLEHFDDLEPGEEPRIFYLLSFPANSAVRSRPTNPSWILRKYILPGIKPNLEVHRGAAEAHW